MDKEDRHVALESIIMADISSVALLILNSSNKFTFVASCCQMCFVWNSCE